MTTKGRNGQTAPRPPSLSKRWETTMRSDMERTASAIRQCPTDDLSNRRKDIHDRKIHNVKTSIIFGNEKINYISDTKESQRSAYTTRFNSFDEEQKNHVKQLKEDLTRTSFKFGPEVDDDKSKYLTVNQLGFLHVIEHPMDANEHAEKKALNKSLKESVKKSSIVFGNDQRIPIYESVTKEQMRGEKTPDTNEIIRRKQEIREMKKELRDPKFKIGLDYSEEFNVDQYKTNYKNGYGSVPIDAYREAHSHKDEIASLISDFRESHFQLKDTEGEKTDYQSASHYSMEKVYKNAQGVDTSKLRKDELLRAKAMKAGLVSSTFEIGTDKEYF